MNIPNEGLVDKENVQNVAGFKSKLLTTICNTSVCVCVCVCVRACVRACVRRPNEFKVCSSLAYSQIFISTFRTMPMYNVWGSKTDGDNFIYRELAQWVWVGNYHEIQNTSCVSFVVTNELQQNLCDKCFAVCSKWWRKPVVWAVYYKYVHLGMDPALSMK